MSYPCPLCNSKLRSYASLIQHLEYCIKIISVFQGVKAWETKRAHPNLFINPHFHQKSVELLIATEATWHSSSSKYICPCCKIPFLSLEQLQSHYDSGIHYEYNFFVCTGCNKTKRRFSSIVQHQQYSTSCVQLKRLSCLVVHDFMHENLAVFANYQIASWCNFPEATLYFDGASRGNPGDSAAAYILYDHDLNVIEKAAVAILHDATNNEAEFTGLIHGLKSAIRNNVKELVVRGDAQVIIYQLNGSSRVRAENLLPLYFEAKGLATKLLRIQFEWIHRSLNDEADKLAGDFLDGKGDASESASNR